MCPSANVVGAAGKISGQCNLRCGGEEHDQRQCATYASAHGANAQLDKQLSVPGLRAEIARTDRRSTSAHATAHHRNAHRTAQQHAQTRTKARTAPQRTRNPLRGRQAQSATPRRQRLLLIDTHVSVPYVRKVSHGGGENTIHALAHGACLRADRVRRARALLELTALAKHAGLRVAARPRRSAPCSRCSARSSRPGARAHTQVTAARARRRAVPQTRTSSCGLLFLVPLGQRRKSQMFGQIH